MFKQQQCKINFVSARIVSAKISSCITRHMSDFTACADSQSGLPLVADQQVMTSK